MVQSFMTNIVDDNNVECIERFSVMMISISTCGVTIGNNNSTEVVIRDGDDDGKLTRHVASYPFVSQRYTISESICWFVCAYLVII